MLGITTLLALGLAALTAGLIDAVVGGGGLIQLPALFLSLPGYPVAAILGTNKLAAMSGTAVSAFRYQRILKFDLKPFFPALVSALVGSYVGARLAVYLNPEIARPIIVFLLCVVWVFLILKPDFGKTAKSEINAQQLAIRSSAIALTLGLYDGFFGPGTGTWFVASGILFLGLDFLHSSAFAKTMNLATNAAALVSFGLAGTVYWTLGAYLGVCNIIGSVIGTRLALKHGSQFVRKAFLAIVGLLILRLGSEMLGWY